MPWLANIKDYLSSELEYLKGVGFPIALRSNALTCLVLGKQRLPFKRVFSQAQIQLRTKFGREMVELPLKEKITMKDKRC
jgi:hypothetical protein